MIEIPRKDSNWCDLNNCEEIDKDCDKSNSDCCCGIDTLRKILELFQRENLEIVLFTSSQSFIGIIFDITEDLVYISQNPSDNPNAFVPLCNISTFSTTIDSDELSNEVREEILSLISPTCNTNPCCCTDGVADTINNIRRFSDPTNGLFIGIQAKSLQGSICVDIGNIVIANDDVVFIDIEFTESEGHLLRIISTCAISSLMVTNTCPGD